MKAAGHPSRWKEDVGKRKYNYFFKSTLRVLTLAMCFLLFYSCSNKRDIPKTKPRRFGKIDFAWVYNYQSYGGISVDSSGKALIFSHSRDSQYILDTAFNDLLMDEIDSLVNLIPPIYSCLDHIKSDTSTVKIIDSPIAMIEIHSAGKLKTSRCYITVFPGENRLMPLPPEKHVLNFFFALHSQLRLKLTPTNIAPSSTALDSLNTFRLMPPPPPPIKFTVPED